MFSYKGIVATQQLKSVLKNMFLDEGSGAEVLLRPGDAVIVRGASQLRGHLVLLHFTFFI